MLVAEQFDREFACSEREWLALLPQAVGGRPATLVAQALTVPIEAGDGGDAGELALSWRQAPARAASKPDAPRLLASFRFRGLDDLARYRFMRRFDLVLQRAAS